MTQDDGTTHFVRVKTLAAAGKLRLSTGPDGAATDFPTDVQPAEFHRPFPALEVDSHSIGVEMRADNHTFHNAPGGVAIKVQGSAHRDILVR